VGSGGHWLRAVPEILLALAAEQHPKKNRNIAPHSVPSAPLLEATPARAAALRRSRAPQLSRAFGSRAPKTGQHNRVSPNAAAAAQICTMMKLLALLATATALKQQPKALAVRGGGIDKAGVVKAVNIAWGLYAAQMLLVPSKIQNDHFEQKATTMTDFAWRGHGVSVAAGMWALTKLDTEDAFKMAMAWVAGIAIACPYNAKFDLFGTYKQKYPMHYVPELLMPGLLAAGFIANRAE